MTMITKTIRAAAIAATLAAGTAASAAVIDFTAAGAGTAGAIAGTTYTVTGSPIATNNTQLFDGASKPTTAFGLAFKTDGFGIGDDEVGVRESITVTFAKAVRITGFAFLDIFQNVRSPRTGEYGILTSGATVIQALFNTANTAKGGYTEALFGPIVTSSVTFTVGNTNDISGVADGALAALEVAPIPVPAAGLLLLTALGGVAALRRRKSA